MSVRGVRVRVDDGDDGGEGGGRAGGGCSAKSKNPTQRCGEIKQNIVYRKYRIRITIDIVISMNQVVLGTPCASVRTSGLV